MKAMEVLPCSNSQHTEQVEASGVGVDDLLVTMEDFSVEHLNNGEGTDNRSLLESESGDFITSTSSNANLTVDTTETELIGNNNGEGELSPSDPKWLQQDGPIALWVKWRGKWQAGIRCAKADWPLATLRGKPTHDRKKYSVIFFPHTKNYSWADMQLVRPIDEFPEPIAYKSHRVGLKMVKDLTAAHRYIMRKLAVGMLNMVDQFHSEVVVETARDVTIWKEIAKEASRGSGYRDLGRMLLKLQSMILQCYINPIWLKNSFPSWVQKCNDAMNAEIVELLKEELDNSILWNEVKSTVNAPMQLTLLSEWKTWKHEVTKWFSISRSGSNVGETDLQNSEGLCSPDVQSTRKRPKLEIRRAETHSSQMESNASQEGTTVGIDSEFFSCRDSTITTEVMKEAPPMDEDAIMNTPKNSLDQWDNIIVEAAGSRLMRTNEADESSPADVQHKDSGFSSYKNESIVKKSVGSGNKSQQCIAFIESKGRQCVRWANEGDVYCCVHLASRFTAKPTKTEISPAVETPMCGGVTVLGTKCKHRSLPGSLFCKKHRPQSSNEKPVHSSVPPAKRKLEEIMSIRETTDCREIVPYGEIEVPLHGGPSFEGSPSNGNRSFSEMLKHCSNTDSICVGSCSDSSYIPCHDSSTRHTLYCDQHLPNWLKRARNGKSRIISKEVFLELLRDCSSRKEKLCLHQACDLFYKLFKSVLSLRNTVPMDVQLQWAIVEASRDDGVGEFLLKLVSREKERLIRIWGFNAGEDASLSSFAKAESATPLLAIASVCDDENREIEEKEKWSFRGFACAICLDSFVDRKLLETHVEERHHVQFAEKCMLLQCIPCGSHFGDNEQLLFHVQAVHPSMCQLPKVGSHEKSVTDVEPSQIPESGNTPSAVSQKRENLSGVQKFVCKFCGVKFDLLPDLGRHHQAEHMGSNVTSSRCPVRGVKFSAYRMKSGRLSRPNRFKKGIGAASYRIRNRANVSMKRRMQASKSLGSEGLTGISPPTDVGTLGRLTDSHCSIVAKILFSKIQKTKPRPNNLDIMSAARSACCRLSLKASLEAKFGILPETIYLKAAKLCSEHGIQVQWHWEGYVCPNGCKRFKDPSLLSPLVPQKDNDGFQQCMDSREYTNNDLEVDECHCIMESHHFSKRPPGKTTVLCNDISFGQESVPVACVVDEGRFDSTEQSERPWESFTYITKPMLNPSMALENKNLQMGCSCRISECSPETCDHVYLFDNDFEEAKDIRGRSMKCRFPYDDKGRIILEEGYPVYECNEQCGCSRTCQNRVLQNGVRMKLEIFKTEKKGWGLRAREPILRGTFICEYIGEVIDQQEANKRRNMFGKEGCSYMQNIDANINDIGRLIEGEVDYVIDATKYGNVARFINHSCLPNLVTHQVLLESMESSLAHIGVYASSDIAEGEELTRDYGHQLLSSEREYPCHCEALNCRGRMV